GVGLGDLPGLVVGLEDRAHRVGPDDLEAGLLLLEVAARARDRAAGAHAGHVVGDPAAGLLPDLGSGGAVVGLGIRGVAVLVGEVGARALARDAARDRIVGLRGVGRDGGGREPDLGAEGLEQVDLLARDLVGHAEHRLV